MHKFYWIALVFTVSLSACAPYVNPLEQKLAGKNLEEKRTILADECGKETDAGLNSNDPATVQHSERMRQICTEMTGKPVP
jgi:hypothetical protein